MRERILQHAADLFMKQGYLGTSTRQIAKNLGITQPALYHHYKNKETLYAAVLTRFAQDIGSDFNSILDENLNAQESLLKMCSVLKEKHPINFGLMMNDLTSELSPEVTKDFYEIWQKNYYTPFCLVFDKMKDDIDPQYELEELTCHFLRVLSAYLSDNHHVFVNKPLHIETIIQIFIKGITKNHS